MWVNPQSSCVWTTPQMWGFLTARPVPPAVRWMFRFRPSHVHTNHQFIPLPIFRFSPRIQIGLGRPSGLGSSITPPLLLPSPLPFRHPSLQPSIYPPFDLHPPFRPSVPPSVMAESNINQLVPRWQLAGPDFHWVIHFAMIHRWIQMNPHYRRDRRLFTLAHAHVSALNTSEQTDTHKHTHTESV